MNILLLNQPWLAPELRSLGHTVVIAGHNPGYDIRLFKPVTEFKEILSVIPEGKQPDVIFLLDNSSPLIFTGFAEIKIPIVFISVDTFHHLELHSSLASICTLTYVAQKTCAQQMINLGAKASWLPLWLSNKPHRIDGPRNGRAAFIGTLDNNLNPRRVRFFENLKKLVDVDVFSGSWLEHFPNYDIIINQSVKDDLNFRVFETMGSNRLLLTERTDNGLNELFEDGKHLVTYEPDNVEEAAKLIRDLTGDLDKTRAIAHAGYLEIQSKHMPEHRIERIFAELQQSSLPVCKSANLIDVKNLNHLSFLWEGSNDERSLRTTLEYGIARVEQAIAACEDVSENLAANALMLASRYDQRFESTRGKDILTEADKLYSGFIEVAVNGVAKQYASSQKHIQEKDALRKSLGFE